MAISSAGIGSGLDINGIISQLMSVEQQPLVKLTTQEASYQAKLSSLGSVRGALSGFQGAVRGLTDPSKFNAIGATSSDSTVATVSGSAAAVPGSYGLKVNALAQDQKLTTSGFSDSSAVLGTGTLTIQFGTITGGTLTNGVYTGSSFTVNSNKPSTNITIDASKNTLAGVRDAINAANAGVSASIVNDGSGANPYRLVLTSKDTGAANAVKISVADDDGNNTNSSGLSLLAHDITQAAGTGQNLTQTQVAQDAQLTIDGLSMTKSSNTVTDAIQGVTLNLLKVQDAAAATVKINVSRDNGSLVSAVEAFVKGYNDLAKTLTELTAYDPKTKSAAPLQGDAGVRGLQSQLRTLMNGKLANNTFSSLSQLGVAFQKDGKLALDKTKLQKAIDQDQPSVLAAFGAYGVPTNSNVKFVSSTKGSVDGNYAVSVTQVATRAVLNGSNVAAPTTLTAANNNFNLTVDGTASGTITLAAGTYTSAQLVAEMQSKINGDTTLKNAGKEVTVAYDGSKFVLTSKKYGSASTVNMGTGAAGFFTDFGFTASQAGTAGVDVAGSLGATAGTGSGQDLTGAGGASGIKVTLNVAAAGEYGSVKFSRGFAAQLDVALDEMLSSKGALTAKTDGINRSIKAIDQRRTAITRRLADTEKRFREQFTRLDTVLAGLQRTNASLTQQLAALPKTS